MGFLIKVERDHRCDKPAIYDPKVHEETCHSDAEHEWPRDFEWASCRILSDGCVWRCDECGLTYESEGRHWRRLSLVPPTPVVSRRSTTIHEGNSDLAVAGAFVAGAMLGG